MNIDYTNHGPYGVTIIEAPKIFGNRLGCLSMRPDGRRPGQDSWALRDFITGVMLKCEDSRQSLADIEAEVIDCGGHPEYRAVTKKREWAKDLEDRSKRKFGSKYDAVTPPSNSWGKWRRLS
jgi:hypothetical protein